MTFIKCPKCFSNLDIETILELIQKSKLIVQDHQKSDLVKIELSDIQAKTEESEPYCILPSNEDVQNEDQNLDHLDIVDFKPDSVPNLVTQIFVGIQENCGKLDDPFAPERRKY